MWREMKSLMLLMMSFSVSQQLEVGGDPDRLKRSYGPPRNYPKHHHPGLKTSYGPPALVASAQSLNSPPVFTPPSPENDCCGTGTWGPMEAAALLMLNTPTVYDPRSELPAHIYYQRQKAGCCKSSKWIPMMGSPGLHQIPAPNLLPQTLGSLSLQNLPVQLQAPVPQGIDANPTEGAGSLLHHSASLVTQQLTAGDQQPASSQQHQQQQYAVPLPLRPTISQQYDVPLQLQQHRPSIQQNTASQQQLLTYAQQANHNAAHIQQANHNAAHIQQANHNAAYIQQANHNAAHIQQANHNAAHIQQANQNAAHVQQANHNAAHIHQVNHNAAHIQQVNHNAAHIHQANHNAAQIQQASHNAAQIQQANHNAAQIQQANHNAAQIQQANYNAAQIQQANHNAAHIQQANYNAAQIQQANHNAAKIQQANYNAAKIQQANHNAAQIQQANQNAAQIQQANQKESLIQNSIQNAIKIQQANYKNSIQQLNPNTARIQQVNYVPQLQQSNQNGPQIPQANHNIPQSHQANHNIHQLQQANQNRPQLPQANQNIPQSHEANHNIHQLQQANQNIHQLQQANQNSPRLPQANQNGPQLPQANQNVPQVQQANYNIAPLPHQNGAQFSSPHHQTVISQQYGPPTLSNHWSNSRNEGHNKHNLNHNVNSNVVNQPSSAGLPLQAPFFITEGPTAKPHSPSVSKEDIKTQQELRERILLQQQLKLQQQQQLQYNQQQQQILQQRQQSLQNQRLAQLHSQQNNIPVSENNNNLLTSIQGVQYIPPVPSNYQVPKERQPDKSHQEKTTTQKVIVTTTEVNKVSLITSETPVQKVSPSLTPTQTPSLPQRPAEKGQQIYIPAIPRSEVPQAETSEKGVPLGSSTVIPITPVPSSHPVTTPFATAGPRRGDIQVDEVYLSPPREPVSGDGASVKTYLGNSVDPHGHISASTIAPQQNNPVATSGPQGQHQPLSSGPTIHVLGASTVKPLAIGTSHSVDPPSFHSTQNFQTTIPPVKPTSFFSQLPSSAALEFDLQKDVRSSPPVHQSSTTLTSPSTSSKPTLTLDVTTPHSIPKQALSSTPGTEATTVNVIQRQPIPSRPVTFPQLTSQPSRPSSLGDSSRVTNTLSLLTNPPAVTAKSVTGLKSIPVANSIAKSASFNQESKVIPLKDSVGVTPQVSTGISGQQISSPSPPSKLIIQRPVDDNYILNFPEAAAPEDFAGADPEESNIRGNLIELKKS